MDLPINQIICGDCLEVMRDWPDNCVDLVLTDPPYQLNTTSAHGGKINPWADLCNSAYWFAELFRVYLRLLKTNGAIWQFLNWRSLPTIQKATFDAGTKITSLMVWDKIWIGPGGCQGLRPRYELIALIAKSEFGIERRDIPDICQCLWSGKKPTGHPAEKPAEVCRGLIEVSSGDDALILDPFSGSGTVCVAAKELGRRYIGIELNEGWAKYSRDRIKAVETGVPVKEAGKGQMGLW
jgi:site-specific DNA-methyltransferase (adenine-specific)